MSDPLVTVVTPSYNHGRFIRATIESVLSQDYPNLEYIIMDGGSTDETAAIARDYASRLTFISEKDRGQSHAINKGFRMGRGSILSWLNSDDLYLPGAVRTAVAALDRNPSAGAVYGDGYLIDETGRVTGRFRATEPFDLWKLAHLSDYILQQTVYFRKAALEEAGYLNEDYHYTMDWDILIRIGGRHPLVYVPRDMGCLREYPEAKSFAGGAERVREIHALLTRHTGRSFPPGYITYGLETYQKLACDAIGRVLSPVGPLARALQSGVRVIAGLIIARTSLHAQGRYSDGWAGRVLRYMLPPGGAEIVVEGAVPGWPALRDQRLRVEANGRQIGVFPVSGDFHIVLPLPPECVGRTLDLTITASRSRRTPLFAIRGGSRPLAYRLEAIGWRQDVDAARHRLKSTTDIQ